MKKEDIKLLLEIKANCLKDYGTTTGTYSDTKRLLKANAISNALNEIERLNKGIKTILDIADKEKILVEEKWSSSGEHKEFYEITFDYDFLKSILVGSDKE